MRRMTRFSILRICGLWFVLSWAMFASAHPITTELSRSPVGIGETFQIIYTLDGQVANVTPDFSPLQKDFNILGTGKSSQFTMINGKTDSVTQWKVNVSARRTGELMIPAINFGNQTSEVVRVDVLGSQQLADQGQPQDIFMEVTVESEHPYVQSQIIYSTRIYTAADVVNANLSLPEADNALFIRLGDDWQYTAERYGRLYQVVERRYAMFPEASGELTIYAPIFSGISVNSNPAFSDPFFDKVFAAPFQVQGSNARLEVLPVPAAYSAKQWLPAQQVELQDSWSQSELEVKVGEPITRTVTLQAKGVTVAQLPSLTMTEPKDVNVYPDKPSTENKLSDGNILAEKTQNFVYIPSEAGEITLPALQVDWWNVKTQRLERAQLPKVQLTVLPAPSITTTDQETMAEKPTPSKPVALNDTVVSDAAPVTDSTPSVESVGQWSERMPWIIAASFALLWLVTIGGGWLWWHRRRPKHSKNPSIAAGSDPFKTTLAALKQACQRHDPRAAREQLLAWVKLQWPQLKITTLHEVAHQRPQLGLSEAIEQLNKALYDEKTTPHSWNGESLWLAVQQILTHASSHTKETDELPPLHLN